MRITFLRKMIPLSFALCATALLSGAAKTEAADLASSSVWGTEFSESAQAITRDKEGNLYVLADYFKGDLDLLVMKLNPTGDTLLGSFTLGGTKTDEGRDIAVDGDGNIYLLAQSDSFDEESTPNVDEGFPVTSNAYLHEDLYWKRFTALTVLCKVNPAMDTLLYSTRFEATIPTAMDLDPEGKVYLTATATEWFDTYEETDWYQPNNACPQKNPAPMAAKFDLDRSGKDSLVYATYIGGTACGDAQDIAVDDDGNAYLTGSIEGQMVSVTSNAPQKQFQGGTRDLYVAKLNPAGSELLFNTHLGGEGGDTGGQIALGPDQDFYVTGSTYSENFPTTPGVLQPDNPNGGRLPDQNTVTRFNADGSIAYSTYLGGAGSEAWHGQKIAVGADGSAYLVGYTESTDFPTVNPFRKNLAGSADLYVSVLNPSGSALTFSSYLGGAKFENPTGTLLDEEHKMLSVVGYTASPDFPMKNALAIENLPGKPVDRTDATGDIFLARIDLAATPAPAVKKGDVNNDTHLDVADAILALRYSVGAVTLDSNQFFAADVVADEQVNVADAVKILKVAVGADTIE